MPFRDPATAGPALMARIARAPQVDDADELARAQLRILAPRAAELVAAADEGELERLLALNPETGPRRRPRA